MLNAAQVQDLPLFSFESIDSRAASPSASGPSKSACAGLGRRPGSTGQDVGSTGASEPRKRPSAQEPASGLPFERPTAWADGLRDEPALCVFAGRGVL